MNLAKMNRILEIFWWAMAGVTFIIVFVMTFVDSFDQWVFYYLAPVICVVVALVRRFMGKKLEKSQAFRDKDKDKK